MTILKFDETENMNESESNLQEENMKNESLKELIKVNDQPNDETQPNKEVEMNNNTETTNNVETQVDFETMEISDVTNDNVKAFLDHHVSKVNEDSKLLTGSHLKARAAFTASLINIGQRINKMYGAFKAHKSELPENTWREYFNNHFTAKFYRSAEDYKRLASISEIENYCVLGKDRLLAVVKTFKDDLEGENPKTMSQLLDDKSVSYDDLEDDEKVTQFINDVDVMVIVKKFADENIDQNKVKTVIENHRRYNKLVCKLQMVKKNNCDVNEYLDAIVEGNWGSIRELEGRNTVAAANATGTTNETETAETETPVTLNQIAEEVKTYISAQKEVLQSAAGENSDQYSDVINLMEQLEVALSRLNTTDRQAA